MRFHTAHAICKDQDVATNARDAVKTIRRQLLGFDAGMLIFFSSMAYDPDTLAAEMQAAFPNAKTLGCTSAGEGVDDLVLNASVVAMAFAPEVFDYNETAIVLDDYAGQNKTAQASGKPFDPAVVFPDVPAAMHALNAKTGQRLLDLDHRKYVGFILGDLITPFMESLTSAIGDLTNVFFTGGAAGDDYLFADKQRLFYNGRAYHHGAVINLWKPAKGFEIMKTQAAEVTDRNLVITKSYTNDTIVREFDNRPAAIALAEKMGIPVDKLDMSDFEQNPMANIVDGEPYLRIIFNRVENNGLQFFLRAPEGMRMNVTRAAGLYEKTRQDLEVMRRKMGDIGAILHINCCSRHSQLQRSGDLEAFGKLFGFAPTVALSSYGEIWVGCTAMTSTMILFR